MLLPPPLPQAKAELPNMAAAVHRSKHDLYSKLALGDAAQALQDMDAKRAAQREQWAQQFQQQLAAQGAAGGEDYLAQLPEHCVKVGHAGCPVQKGQAARAGAWLAGLLGARAHLLLACAACRRHAARR